MTAKEFLKNKNIVGKVDRAYIEKWCEEYHIVNSNKEEGYIECELNEVPIGAPILIAKRGCRTSELCATFPNDYEAEKIYLRLVAFGKEDE